MTPLITCEDKHLNNGINITGDIRYWWWSGWRGGVSSVVEGVEYEVVFLLRKTTPTEIVKKRKLKINKSTRDTPHKH